MIWLTWRQFRTQAAAIAVLLAALLVVLALTGPGLASDYNSGIATCSAQGGDCSTFTARFFSDHQTVFVALIVVMMVLPGLLGLFWGAPLISRELEAGTHKLVWNQTVTRAGWLAAKLGLVGLAAVVAAGLCSLAVGWWSSPLDKTAGRDFPRMAPVIFDGRGVVILGHALFAFVLGVAVGMLVRRSLATMALTLAGFIALQIAMPLLVRPHLATPVRSTVTVTAKNLESLMSENGPDGPVIVRVKAPDEGAWVLSNRTVDASGREVSKVPISLSSGQCAPQANLEGPSDECLAQIGELGYRQEITYHPSSRFWTLQWRETGIYLALSLALGGFCFWRIRRLS